MRSTFAWPFNLSELLYPTPSGVSKLLAAWDGLSLDLQIEALQRTIQHPAYLADKVLMHALSSSNAYVRYVAAKHLRSSSDKSLELATAEATIGSDPNPLVRFAQLERDWSWRDSSFKDPEKFFGLPHEARLAKVRALTGASEVLASNILYATKNLLATGVVTELELHEIIADYILKPEFQTWYGDRENYARQFGDGYSEFSAGNDLKSLWALIPELPLSLASLLVAHLPVQAGFSNNLAEQTAQKLPEKLLIQLFNRPAGLGAMRKKLFFDRTNSENLRTAAVCCDFELSFEEFEAMLFDLSPYRKTGLKAPDLTDSEPLTKLKDLRILALFADDLSIVIQQALVDFLRASPSPQGTFLGGPYEDAGFALDRLKSKLATPDSLPVRELRSLRIYLLARTCVSWRSGEPSVQPGGPLAFLSSSIDDGSPWRTFMAFSKEWAKRAPIDSELDTHLPAVPEVRN